MENVRVRCTNVATVPSSIQQGGHRSAIRESYVGGGAVANDYTVLLVSCCSWKMFLVFAFSLLAVALGAPLAREQPRGFGSAKHVLVIGCDGLGEVLGLVWLCSLYSDDKASGLFSAVAHVKIMCTRAPIRRSVFPDPAPQEVCTWRTRLSSCPTLPGSTRKGPPLPAPATRCHLSAPQTGRPSSQVRGLRRVAYRATTGCQPRMTLPTRLLRSCRPSRAGARWLMHTLVCSAVSLFQ